MASQAYSNSRKISFACHKNELNFDSAVTMYQQGVLQVRRKDMKQARGFFVQAREAFSKVFKGQEKSNSYVLRVVQQIEKIDQKSMAAEDDFM